MIGIYGGTFDPVHFGHLRPAVDVYTSLSLSKIHFIPCGQPPHRAPSLATAQQRMEMLELALQRHPEFVVDDRELRRAGTSYMVDTIRSLMEDFPQEKLCLIVGMDAFLAFHTWHEWQEITRLVNLIVTHRPSFDPESISESDLSDYLNENRTDDMSVFHESEKTCCLFCPVTQLDISSTRIRELVSKGDSIDYLLPALVADYILENGLYK
jgi:nicotinate-nucleotide adenylyltransferase